MSYVYLSQPIEPEELLATVATGLRSRRAEKEALITAARFREADQMEDEVLVTLAHELRPRWRPSTSLRRGSASRTQWSVPHLIVETPDGQQSGRLPLHELSPGLSRREAIIADHPLGGWLRPRNAVAHHNGRSDGEGFWLVK
ncbi:hypothetical protein [Citreicoccus inhibens]|uniref:hypothetical protein n=1 Tax=Citreicoccus inhibens TaxID=2849499 RepID=UPI001C22494F|nr:hypothetical protein [Citreicoccus inhibens]